MIRLVSFAFGFCLSVGALTPEEAKIYAKLEEKLGTELKCIVRVQPVGFPTIEMEAFLSAEADRKLTTAILSDNSKYASWVLPGINERPKTTGGSYYIHILNIVALSPGLLGLDLNLSIPVLGGPFQRKFHMWTSQNDAVFTLGGAALPKEDSIIIGAEGFLKVFPAGNDSSRVWIYVAGTLRVKNWIYHLFPQKPIEREAQERIQKIIENYQKAER